MPTPDWRYEKSSTAVKALCRLLQTEMTEEQISDVHDALHCSLRIMCDAISEGDTKRGDVWTPGIVKLFVDQPDMCGRWLELLDEPDFKPDYYSQESTGTPE